MDGYVGAIRQLRFTQFLPYPTSDICSCFCCSFGRAFFVFFFSHRLSAAHRLNLVICFLHLFFSLLFSSRFHRGYHRGLIVHTLKRPGSKGNDCMFMTKFFFFTNQQPGVRWVIAREIFYVTFNVTLTSISLLVSCHSLKREKRKKLIVGV